MLYTTLCLVFQDIQMNSHDVTQYKKPISIPGNALKLTSGNVELQICSRGSTPGPML